MTLGEKLQENSRLRRVGSKRQTSRRRYWNRYSLCCFINNKIYECISKFIIFFSTLFPENVDPTTYVLCYSVAVRCAGSIEQNHTHPRCPMLSTMYKTQTSTRRDLLQMSHFLPAEVELLRRRNLAPVAECVFPVSVFSFLAGFKLFSPTIISH